MSDEKQKTNFLAAGLSQAVPARGVPPPPPHLKKPKERIVENGQDQNSAVASEQEKGDLQLPDVAIIYTQDGEEPLSQVRKEDDTQMKESALIQQREKVVSQPSENIASSVGGFSEEQLRQLAEMVTNVVATTQTPKKEKVKKVDLNELLLQAIAGSEVSDDLKSKFQHIASSQKAKINQGVFAPEALFTLYRNASLQISLTGKKVSAGDLMAQALIAYIPRLVKELTENE